MHHDITVKTATLTLYEGRTKDKSSIHQKVHWIVKTCDFAHLEGIDTNSVSGSINAVLEYGGLALASV